LDYQSLGQMFLAQAERYGNRALYRYAQDGRWRSLAWSDALAHVREIALGLVSLGIARGDRVAIISNNRVEWHLVDWADICIGALTVPIYASSSSSQALHILGHSEPSVLFIDSCARLKKLHSLSRNQLKAIVTFEAAGGADQGEAPVRILTLDALRAIGAAHESRHKELFRLLVQSLRPEDDLTIIYTSGTTGMPKGVLTTHAHYLFMMRAVDSAIPSTEQDTTLHFLPTAHSLGRLEHFMAVAKGWTMGIARSIETLPSDLQTVRPTVIFSVPRIYENAYKRIRLRTGRAGFWRRKVFTLGMSVGKRVPRPAEGVKPGWIATAALACVDRLALAPVRATFGGRLRLAISGGASLARNVAEFFHALGILILEGYGLTESSTVSHVNRLRNYQFGTVGQPLEGTECRVAADGEILLRGPHIFKGYYRDLLATEEAIDADGWFHTGDIGTADAHGFLRITDRKKDLIVTSGGKKISPQKLENLLMADPLIRQALVVGRGEGRPLALINLDRTRVAELAAGAGMLPGTAAETASHPWVRARVKEIIQKTNKELAPFETIRNFCILDRDLTVEDEELTPTLKLRRQVVVERYRNLIEDMYRKAS
jgi:long-chain acyl-CoA synthetase